MTVRWQVDYSQGMSFPESPVLATARLLVARMERLSADSHWAHRASGLRGSLLRAIELVDQAAPADQEILLSALEQLNQHGFALLTRAAHEIRPPDAAPN